MTEYPIGEHRLETARHATAHLACGTPDAPPIVFVHGWPELSHSWRKQLPVFAGLGFRAIAPDMRGYGNSAAPARHDDYALEHIVADMIELLDHLGAPKAVWVGHDWGAPVVWSIAQQHPDRCHGVAALCVPYFPGGFDAESAIELSDRSLYPKDRYPAAQWDYQFFYRENFAAAVAAFEANVPATVRALFRAGSPSSKRQPARTATIRADCGWFGGRGAAPDMPRDDRVLSEEAEGRYVEALQRNGFFGPDSWYMNAPANAAYAERARAGWRLEMPVLFLHAAYDGVCETLDSRLAEPMRAHCASFSEVTVASGHWMAQERPTDVNAALARWLALRLPQVWSHCLM